MTPAGEVGSTLTREEILDALGALSSGLGERGVVGEICLFADIIFLIRHLRMGTSADVLNLVAQYYPKSQIAVKTQFLVEGLFDEGSV